MWGLLFCLCGFSVCYGAIPSLEVAHRYKHLVQEPLDTMPRTIKEAEQMNFSKVGECEENPKFEGIPYRRSLDFHKWKAFNQRVLFDISGDVAGIQIGKSVFASFGALLGRPFIRDGDFELLTIYFKEPVRICNAGTPVSQEGSYEVFLQLGETPLSTIGISLTERDLDPSRWRIGPCVSGIGQHYWMIFDEELGSVNMSSSIFTVFDKSGNLFSIGYSLLYDKPPHHVRTISNPVLEKALWEAAPKRFTNPGVYDYVYVFFSRKWIPSYCLFSAATAWNTTVATQET